MNNAKPQMGAKWSLPELMAGTGNFYTMIGDYEAEPKTPFQPEMSLHFYRLPKGEIDMQRPHNEDELYYVLLGSRTIRIVHDGEEVNVPLSTGDLVYVPAHAEHKFIGEEEISLLVFFAPNYSGHSKD
ncbi:cupin domain-containing protein [Chryseolinea sp. T2]|uniref:cupin domain-containing protein n=1 Tax=Chryseolinea sp. T2 TaxID=3129255 RepID=UPI0030774E14